MKKIGIDLGNNMIKFSATSGENQPIVKGYIPSAIDVRSGSAKFSTAKGRGASVTCLNKTIFLGQGIQLVSIDKTNREYLEHQILYCVYAAFGSGAHTIKIAVGLPIKQYAVQKDIYAKRLASIAKIDGSVNGEAISINVVSSVVCAEGYSSLYLFEDKVSKFNPTLIIDIGYKTIDTLLVRWDDEIKEFNVEKYEGLDCGALYDIYKMIAERLYQMGGTYKPDEIDKRLHSENSLVRLATGDTINLFDKLDLADEVYEQIIRSVELVYGALYQYDLLFTGGGSEIFLKGVAGDRLKNVINTSTDDKYYSNALGYLEQIED